ncbi:septal ring lytic transglycosylase RlpA family protein [Halopseudomonas maritima]|uniref:septal ring lytic transglycosylase RlpA family protein n=1 Tax=Halopseudomonas maritima TaxID=2918528 RepID=UPI0037BF92D7
MKLITLFFVLLWLAGCSTLARGTGEPGYRETGQASYYADRHQNQLTANGERYSHATLTAAHKTLPFDTLVKVTNLDNGKSVVVRINDRGPFVRGRVIDLSKSAFSRIGSLRAGLLRVQLEVERPAPGR